MKDNISSTDLTSIQVALYTINRHAKTALDSSELYYLKRKSLKKLETQNLAEKVCREYSTNPSKGLQSSVVLVKVGTPESEYQFYFHTIAEKGDSQLKHTGKINNDLKNPRIHMRLDAAKTILYNFLGESPQKKRNKKPVYNQNIFVSSYLDGRKR
ncbi:YkyB family protein [Evansella tamaricis]|uniref:Uncharacterized protein n=1 Tax=Evansella tamaricis TaxID=2069301 RepID=A0ABS6JH75_9BACI|nr:YkyB family protein [Evansella tamaricis]MBU9713029.1 hypothetical protein [Evansella tamaricis]